jgi:hypothetical protein
MAGGWLVGTGGAATAGAGAEVVMLLEVVTGAFAIEDGNGERADRVALEEVV